MEELDLKICRAVTHKKEFLRGVPKGFVGNGYTYIFMSVQSNDGRELIAPQPTYRKIQIIDNENVFVIEKDVESDCFYQQHFQRIKDGDFALVNSFPIEVQCGINDPDVIIRDENITARIAEIETKEGIVFYDLISRRVIEEAKSDVGKNDAIQSKKYVKMYQFPQAS